MLGELRAFLIDALEGIDGLFAAFIKLTILGTALAKTHLLDITHQQVNLIVGKCYGFRQQTVSLGIVHGDQRDESQVSQSFCTTVLVVRSKLQGLAGIMRSGIDIAVMIGIGKGIQLIYRTLLLILT